MNEKQHTTEYEDTYQTGRCRPRKSHRGMIAFLLVLVIFLCGISTALGLMNIHLFRQLKSQHSEDSSSLHFSASAYDATLPAEDPVCFGALGLSGETVSDFWQQYLDLPCGIYITDVTAKAAATGLRPGDILLRFRGTLTESVQTLTELLENCEAGETAELVIYRDGQQYTVSVTVESTP